MTELSPRCPRCGAELADPAAACPQCGAVPPLPVAPELEILEEPAAVEVPVGQPARVEALPEAPLLPARVEPVSGPRAQTDRRFSVFDKPLRQDDEPPLEQPRPRIILAMLVLLLLMLATCGGVFVITYAIWAGFKRITPKRAEVPADVRPVFPANLPRPGG